MSPLVDFLLICLYGAAAAFLLALGVTALYWRPPAAKGFGVSRADHRRADHRLGRLVGANRKASYVERRMRQERGDVE